VFFRAESLQDACLILKRIFSFIPGKTDIPITMLVMVILAWVYQLIFDSRLKTILEYKIVRMGLTICLLIYLFFFVSGGHEQFIYFQF